MEHQELRQLRETHKLTQKAFAEMLGYTTNYIARLERGEEPITPRCEKLVRSLFLSRKVKKLS